MAGKNARDDLARLDAELSDLEERVGKARREAQLSATAAEHAEEAKLEATRAEAAGSISRGAARKAYEESAEKAARHEAEGARLAAVAVELEGMLERCRYQHGRAEFAVARQEAASACSRRNGVAHKLADALAEAVKLSAALTRERERATAALARAKELEGDEELGWFAGVDEPDWPEIEGLVELLQAGPVQPRATEEAALKRYRETSGREANQREDRQRAADYVWKGDSDALAAITNEHTTEEARRQHGVVRRRARQQLDPILDDLREKRTSPARALSDLRRMAQIPGDLAAAAEREILALAGPEAEHARAFAGLTHV